MAIGKPTSPTQVFQPYQQRVQFGGRSGPSSPRVGHNQQAEDVFELGISAPKPDAVQQQLAEADRMLPQLTRLLSDIEHGKPVKPIQLPEGNPFKARFEKETAQLKFRQQQERELDAQKYGIQDTPDLRAALLKYGAVANEAELETFMAKFALGPKAA